MASDRGRYFDEMSCARSVVRCLVFVSMLSLLAYNLKHESRVVGETAGTLVVSTAASDLHAIASPNLNPPAITTTTAPDDDKPPCNEPGWDPEKGIMPANATATQRSSVSWRAIPPSDDARRRPWSSEDDDTWPRPTHAPDPLLADGWAAFYARLVRTKCSAHSPECQQVPGWRGCCRVHRMLKAKLVAFSDHMRTLGWPHWFVHSGTLLGLVRERGLLVPHDHDADVLVVATFNDAVVFRNYTLRLLSFNGRYPPFTLKAAAHSGKGRGPWSATPWRNFHFTGKRHKVAPRKWVSSSGDFVVAPMSEFGHMDVSLLAVDGGGYGNACQQTLTGHFRHPSAWTESSGRPAACPFGLKLGNDTFHGINCPGREIPWLEAAYGRGKDGWKNREVKFGSEAKWYRKGAISHPPALPHELPIDTAAAATAADCDEGDPGRRRRRRRLWKQGVRRSVGCHCDNATAAAARAHGGGGVQVRAVVCKPGHRGERKHRHAWIDADGGQAALDKLSREEEAARLPAISGLREDDVKN